MLTRVCDRVTLVVRTLMWIAFAGLIGTVALQVLARNVLMSPLIWTSDVAQLLFAWLIFVGAAVGLRTGAHYRVDMLPEGNRPLNLLADAVALLAGFAVAWLLLYYGWELAMVRKTATVQSLDISRFWMFLPLPVSGGLMMLYLAEAAMRLVAARGEAVR
ncbi:TRAP transporter small permease [Tropicimonas aquimaris]|uniref:TRAP transporter small permease protein n=1 Tax=Tropicimonas aquimaris TaxID=914152 RepID=A0ABW3INC6_9RHOB